MTLGLLLAAALVVIGGTASSNAATAPTGELYRVDPNGQRVELSQSPVSSVAEPLVSPDGKRVAFLGDRSNQEGIYEVGIDGSGLVQVAQDVPVRAPGYGPVEGGAYLAWQPRGGRLAVVPRGFEGAVWIARPGAASLHVRNATGLATWPTNAWSPDGRVLAVDASNHQGSFVRELTVSPDGHVLWTVRNVDQGEGAWSARGLFAITVGGELAGAHQAVAVYDAAGHLQFKVGFGVAYAHSAWSPNGRRIALYTEHGLQVRTATGRLLLRKRLAHRLGWGDLGWLGNDRLVLVGYGTCGCHVRSVDVRTGRVSGASDRFDSWTSQDNRRAIVRTPSGTGFAIQVAPTAGGPPQTYTSVASCNDNGTLVPDAGQFQFVPDSRSIVYVSVCS